MFNVHLESSRLFGVTELRAFMYDFVSPNLLFMTEWAVTWMLTQYSQGPDMKTDCYPSISSSPRSMNREGLKHKPGILSYRVTKYRHKSSGLTNDFN